jgi:hypothetical protein
MAELLSTVNKSILIASSSIDQYNWEPVAVALNDRGYDVTVYEADKVAQGIIPLDVSVDNDAGLKVVYDGKTLDSSSVDAAWYRRSTLISMAIERDRARQIGIDGERKIIQTAIWDGIPNESWLNSPDNIRRAEQKITQLALAHELGFSIPNTVASNRWSTILDTLQEDIVFKISYIYALYCEPDDIRTVYTTPLKNNPDGLPIEGNPFPGLWQENILKAREWRVTIVGDDTFDAAIYTTKDAKDDWRRHTTSSGRVDFRAESFPDDQKEKCFQYLGRFGLRFGAFDFIEGSDGKMTFLECNANGQYKWLENNLGFPISEAIANELATIADRN